ncbi:MAG TPA: M20/M25/M40 family metallo-hydrolase [Gaiellaceae bacterium]|jgi:acetylornithine deacetylase/succinyl-diaminopimelate desuccinylase-like protein
MAAISIRDEATELLQELLRADTVNPPGNETKAAELLRAYLEGAGVECELYAKAPERANIVARLPGRGGPTLALISHTDTVRADPEEWTLDPWSGELRDGEIWGRGALDMKSQVAASAVAIAILAREGFVPAGDLIFVASADEEVGEDFGLSWLCANHPDAIRADYCVNEGGGDRLVVDGRPAYLCGTAEKMSSPFLLRVHGRSGHASMPGIADNALIRAARLIQRLAAYRPKTRVLPEAEAFLRLVGTTDPAELDPPLAAIVEPMLSHSISPTIIEASKQRNVIPALCELVCDCRLLPGETQEQAEIEIRAALGEDDYDFIWLEGVGGTASPLGTPLWSAIESFVAEEEPGAVLVPVVLAGFTDSHFMREAFGTVCYGFFPMRAMDSELASGLIHSADERIPVDDLELGTRFLLHVARTLGE